MLKLRRPKKKYSYSEIYDFIRQAEMNMYHLNELRSYYDGKNTEINKKTRSEGKSNVKASHPFASKLVDTFTGYFASKPVKYDTDDEEVLALIDDYIKYNDCEEALITLTRDSAIYGHSATMTFLDSKGNIRFCPVNTQELIVICDNSVLEEMHTVIRHWRVENNSGLETHYVEVYTDIDVTKYYIECEDGEVKETSQPQITEHFFKDVPFSIFQFNDGMGLFERVIPLIDAYDLAVSNSLDLSNDLVDAILLIAGCELTNEMMEQIRELRMLNCSEENVRVEFIKNDFPTNEDIKTRLREDIFSLAGIVDLEDKTWGSASSGVALRLRMASTEFKAGVTQGHFIKALRRNLELMLNLKSLTNAIDVDSELREIKIVMQRNAIANETEQIQNALQLSSMLSKETIIGLLQDFVVSPDIELERLASEKDSQQSFMDSYDDNDFNQESNKEEVKVEGNQEKVGE